MEMMFRVQSRGVVVAGWLAVGLVLVWLGASEQIIVLYLLGTIVLCVVVRTIAWTTPEEWERDRKLWMWKQAQREKRKQQDPKVQARQARRARLKADEQKARAERAGWTVRAGRERRKCERAEHKAQQREALALWREQQEREEREDLCVNSTKKL